MKKIYYLISNNEFSFGLKKALEMIIGKQDTLHAFGLIKGEDPAEVAAIIKSSVTKDSEVVIFSDMAEGELFESVLCLARERNVVLVTGTSLPLAIEIIVTQMTDKISIQESIKKAREGMKVLVLTPAEDQEDDFF